MAKALNSLACAIRPLCVPASNSMVPALASISSAIFMMRNMEDHKPCTFELKLGKLVPPSSSSIIFWKVVVIPPSRVVIAGVSTAHRTPVVEYNCCSPTDAARIPSRDEKVSSTVAALGLSKSVSQEANSTIDISVNTVLYMLCFFIVVLF